MRRLLERLLTLLRIKRPDADLNREIESHLRLLQDAYERRGFSPEAARREARLAFGNVAVVRDEHRDARSFRWIEDVRQDASHGLRLLRRSPLFATTAIVSLAIGIGAATAVFTVANGVLLRPPGGIAEPSALVDIGTARGDGGLNPLTAATYRELSSRAASLTSLAGEDLFPHVMALEPPGGEVEAVRAQGVTPNFFSTLGTVPAHGRLFATGDEAAAVLEYGYWQQRFRGDAAVVGRAVRINGRPVSIVGVAARDFQGAGIQQCDLWLTIGSDGASAGNLMARGRLKSGVTFEAAAAELQAIGAAIAGVQDMPTDRARQIGVLPYSRAGGNRVVAWGFSAVLMALVSLVLATACANVAGITLTRATARAREVALRAALGAGRGRLVRQLLTETLVLFCFSGLLGIGLARVLIATAMLVLPPQRASLIVPMTLDWRVLLFTVAVSTMSGVIFGVLPAFRGARVDPAASLNDGTRSGTGRSRLRNIFVVSQIVCSVVLITLAALFVRVLVQVGGARPGFDSHNVEMATLDSSVTGETGDHAALWSTILDGIRQTPSVESASLARVPPGGFEGIGLGGVSAADRPAETEPSSPAWNIVDTDYFATLRIPIVDGRDFTARDTTGAQAVAIVSEALARRFWGTEPAVGKSLRLAVLNARTRRDDARLATIVGVAGDVRSSSLIDGLAEPYVYLPLAQSEAIGASDMTTTMSIVARRRGGARLSGVLAKVVHDVDPRLVLSNTQSLSDSVALGLTPQRVVAVIAGAVGLVALLLASMGMYGVTAYGVTLRRREFAIRLALGAPRSGVIRMVLRQGIWLVAVGLSVGLVLAIGLSQVLAVFLSGVQPTHVPTTLGIIALYLVIGGAACAVPAGQAVREGWRRALQED